MPSHDLDRRLRAALRPLDTTDEQRARYQALLMHREVDDMAFIRRRSLAELAAIAAVLVLVVAAMAYWQRDGGVGDEPSALALAGATQTALASNPADPTSNEVIIAPTATSAGVCPVTPFNPDPPVRFQTYNAQEFPHWYGDEPDGLWAAHGATQGFVRLANDEQNQWFVGVTQMVVWGGADEELTITSRPLDGQAGQIAPVEWVDSSFYGAPSADTRATLLQIPAAGCWELTGRSGERELTIVIDAQPYDERPDIARMREWIALIEEHYPAPESCPVDAWAGPSDRVLPNEFIGATYWLGDESFGLFSVSGFLVAEENNSLGWWSDAGEPVKLDLRLLDGNGSSETLTTELNDPGYMNAAFRFPTAGCWELQITGAGVSERFVIYVRPAEALDLLE